MDTLILYIYEMIWMSVKFNYPIDQLIKIIQVQPTFAIFKKKHLKIFTAGKNYSNVMNFLT